MEEKERGGGKEGRKEEGGVYYSPLHQNIWILVLFDGCVLKNCGHRLRTFHTLPKADRLFRVITCRGHQHESNIVCLEPQLRRNKKKRISGEFLKEEDWEIGKYVWWNKFVGRGEARRGGYLHTVQTTDTITGIHIII